MSETALLAAVGDYLERAHGQHFCTECGVFHVGTDPLANAEVRDLAAAYNAERRRAEGATEKPETGKQEASDR